MTGIRTYARYTCSILLAAFGAVTACGSDDTASNAAGGSSGTDGGSDGGESGTGGRSAGGASGSGGRASGGSGSSSGGAGGTSGATSGGAGGASNGGTDGGLGGSAGVSGQGGMAAGGAGGSAGSGGVIGTGGAVSSPLSIVTTSIADPRPGKPYRGPIRALGGTTTGYSWTLTSGSLPPGLSLTPAGTPSTELKGTATQAGQYTFTVEVTDSAAAKDSQSFTLDVGVERWASFRGPLETVGLFEAWVADVSTATPGPRIRLNGPMQSAGAAEAIYWAPNGRRLVYVADETQDSVREIRLVDFVGGSPQPSVPLELPALSAINVTNVVWSPDSEKLVYMADTTNQGAFEAWFVDLSSPTPGSRVRLHDRLVSGGDVTRVEWAPDGNKVAVLGDVHVSERFELTVADTTTPVPGPSVPVHPGLGPNQTIDGFVWGPDGKRIYYLSGYGPAVRVNVFQVDLSGPAPSAPQLVNGSLPLVGSVRQVAITPDGSKLVYRADQNVQGRDEIFFTDVSGPTPATSVRINGALQTSGDVSNFWVSPNGRKVAYLADSTTDDRIDLHIVDISTASPGTAQTITPVPFPPGDVQAAYFSPDSRWLAFRGTIQTLGVTELYVTDVSGVTPTVANRLNGNLVTGGFVEDDVRFAPDSSGLFYRADQTVDNVTELFWVALGSPPSAPVAINKPLPATGFVQQYAIRSDGAVLYQGLQNPSLTEAFFVTFSGTVPGSPALASGVITPPLGVAAPVLFNP